MSSYDGGRVFLTETKILITNIYSDRYSSTKQLETRDLHQDFVWIIYFIFIAENDEKNDGEFTCNICKEHFELPEV